MTTSEVAHKLGASESAAASCLALLARDDKIRIRVVEGAPRGSR